MKINIEMEGPLWEEDDAQRYLDFLMEEIKTTRFWRDKGARIKSFDVDGEEYMYETPEYKSGGSKGRLAGSMRSSE